MEKEDILLQAEQVVMPGICTICEQPIQKGETYYQIGETMFCCDCLPKVADEILGQFRQIWGTEPT